MDVSDPGLLEARGGLAVLTSEYENGEFWVPCRSAAKTRLGGPKSARACAGGRDKGTWCAHARADLGMAPNVNPQESSTARSHGRPLGVMVGFQDEEMKNFL